MERMTQTAQTSSDTASRVAITQAAEYAADIAAAHINPQYKHSSIPLDQPLEAFRLQQEPWRWDGVDELVYKENDTTFRSVSRRVLFDANGGQGNQVRYFEVGPGGWSTFEHHEHTHEVIIFRGSGTAVIGSQVRQVQAGDLIFSKPWEWHQFSATNDEPLGFICIVTADRDRPVRPTPDDLEKIYADNPQLRGIIRV